MPHFTEEEDITLLREVRATPPFDVEHGKLAQRWEEIAERVSAATRRDIASRSLQDRFATMIKSFKRNEAPPRRASGVSEEASERDDLIEEYLSLKDTMRRATKKGPPGESSSLKDFATDQSSRRSVASEMGEEDKPLAIDTNVSKKELKSIKQSNFGSIFMEHLTVSKMTRDEVLVVMREQAQNEQRRLEFEIKKFEMDAERLERQQRIQEQKDEYMLGILASFSSQLGGKSTQGALH